MRTPFEQIRSQSTSKCVWITDCPHEEKKFSLNIRYEYKRVALVVVSGCADCTIYSRFRKWSNASYCSEFNFAAQ
jgi:hypothetical protein